MKDLSASKSLCLFIALLMMGQWCGAQTSVNPVWTEKDAKAWFNKKVWANNLKVQAHTPLNYIEFAKQYHANKATWDKVMDFLRERNLELMPPGKYPIVGDDAVATLSEGPAKKLDTAGWEAHRRYIDLHFVVKGKEKIGVLGKDSVIITRPYDDIKDVENYYIKGKFQTATPDEFFLFFPGEIHQPNLGNGTVRKLVIKIRAK